MTNIQYKVSGPDERACYLKAEREERGMERDSPAEEEETPGVAEMHSPPARIFPGLGSLPGLINVHLHPPPGTKEVKDFASEIHNLTISG